MKALLAGFAALVAGLLVAPSAHADRLDFIGRCHGCGVPMYGQTIVSGYDCHGHPLYRTIPVMHHCQARRYESPHRQHGYGSYGRDCDNGRGYGYDRGGYGYGYGRSSGCDSRPRVGFSFSIVR